MRKRNQSEPITRVMFRKLPEEESGEIIALFPDDPATEELGIVTSYIHTGQHGAADLNFVVRDTRPAKPAEYASLKRELEGIGYRLKIVQRTPADSRDIRRAVLREDKARDKAQENPFDLASLSKLVGKHPIMAKIQKVAGKIQLRIEKPTKELLHRLGLRKSKNPRSGDWMNKGAFRQLSVPEKHQLRIAQQTLRYSDAGARIMGGPTKAESREIIYRLTGKMPKENPHRRRGR